MMRKIILVSFISSLLFFSCKKSVIEENECFCCNNKFNSEAEGYLKVMTFNLRWDNPEDGINRWDGRKSYVEQMLKSCELDILGTQEDYSNQLGDLVNILTGYNYFSIASSGTTVGLRCSLFFKRDRFEEVQHGFFGLSEDPTKIGLKGWDADQPRVATWAILKDKNDNREILIINTHFDHKGVLARYESAKLIIQKIDELSNNRPYFIMGDLNTTPLSDPLLYLKSNNKLIDSRNIAVNKYGHDGTYHGFGIIAEPSRKTIDYVLVSKEFSVHDHRVIYGDMSNGIYLSDHSPVYVEVKLN